MIRTYALAVLALVLAAPALAASDKPGSKVHRTCHARALQDDHAPAD